MSSGFQILDHTADVGIRVWAKTVPKLFEEAAGAMRSILIEKAEDEPAISRSIRLEAETIEELFLRWLREILFLFEKERVVYTRFQFEKHNLTEKNATAYFLSANLRGFPFSKSGHEVCKEIKAVTRHGFYLKKNEPWWEASVLFDI
jgi:SHS2 domain-containing protein